MKLAQICLTSIIMTESLDDDNYPLASQIVDGLEITNNIDNESSIKASLEDYKILSGIRQLPMSIFGGPRSVFYAKDDFDKSRKLANTIQESNKISPLIVVIDNEGPYILEGAHRYVALCYLNKKYLPALVVIDHSDG